MRVWLGVPPAILERPGDAIDLTLKAAAEPDCIQVDLPTTERGSGPVLALPVSWHGVDHVAVTPPRLGPAEVAARLGIVELEPALSGEQGKRILEQQVETAQAVARPQTSLSSVDVNALERTATATKGSTAIERRRRKRSAQDCA